MTDFPFPAGTGEMGAAVLAHDWARTPLGPLADWPCSLRTAVGLVLQCRLPMYLAWGPEFIQIYNDAYRPILAGRHPAALGAPASSTSQLWDRVAPMWRQALAGEPIGFDDLRMTLERDGQREDGYFNFSYSAVCDDHGRPAGVLVTAVETTARVLAERRVRLQLELADALRGLSDPAEIVGLACRLLGEHLDARRARYVLVDGDRMDIRLGGWSDGSVVPTQGDWLPLALFSPGVVDALRRGETVRLDDVHDDPRTAGHTAFYDDLQTPAMLFVPVLREGRLIAFIGAGAREPRRWTDAEAELMEDVAERTRSAIERAVAERARAELEASHRFVLDRTLAAVVVHDADGAITFSNPMASQLLGLSIEQLQGRVPADPAWHFVRETGEPMPLEEYPVSIVARTRAPLHDYVVGVVDHEGAAPRWVLASAYPELDDGGRPRRTVVSFVDITRRKHSETALRLSEQRSALALEVAQLGTWVWDLATGEVSADARSRQIWGLDDGPLSLETVAARVHPEDWPRIETALQGAVAVGGSGAYAEEFRWLHADGTIVWTLSRGQVLFEGEGDVRRPVSMLGSVIDITERRRLIDALRTADRRKDEFLAMLAHELRNPLAPISTAAQLLRIAAEDPARVRHAAQIISRQVGHMTEMVDDLLDVSRVTRGLVEIEREPVDLRTVIAQAAEQAEPMMQARRHRLRTDLASGSAIVAGDRHRLVQVIANLLNNAAKYTPPGGRIELALRIDEAGAELEVSDTGIGIDEALLPQVFDLFTQAERTPDRAQGGLGIGLALVRSIVQLHGGTVAARSAGSGQGSTFTVRLPLAPPPGRRQEDASQPERASVARRVFVVDDNSDAAETLAAVLRMLGHEVDVADGGAGALAHVAGQDRWDAFIIDIGMPDMTGYELVGRLREAVPGARAQYIALTGYGHSHDRSRAKAAGFDHHLVKPADLAALQALLAGSPSASG